MRHLVLVPLSEEMEYIYSCLIDAGAECRRDFDFTITYYRFRYKISDHKTATIDCHVMGDMGNLRASASTATALIRFKYNYVFLVGLSGSMSAANAKLGDVVISNRVKSFYPDKVAEINERKREVFSTRADAERLISEGYFPVDERKKILGQSYFRFRRDSIVWEASSRDIEDYLDKINSTKHIRAIDGLRPVLLTNFESFDSGSIGLSNDEIENKKPFPYYGTMLSTDMVINSLEYIDFLTEKNDDETFDIYFRKNGGIAHSRRSWFKSALIAADMESYGFYFMARQLREDVGIDKLISVRGISDLARKKEETDVGSAMGIREIAVRNALDVTLDMISFYEEKGSIGPGLRS